LRTQFGRRYHIGQLVGTSPQIRRVRQQVRLASQSRASVLVVGPSGSGREHVTRTIHFGLQAPGTQVGPLVPLDCSLLDARSCWAFCACRGSSYQ
jgi:two-component system response regulator PilR (NtrC family)